MRPQLGNRPTDARQTNRHEAKRPSDQAFIYVVGYIGLSRLFLASYNKARGHDETPARQQTHRHETNKHESKRDPLIRLLFT